MRNTRLSLTLLLLSCAAAPAMAQVEIVSPKEGAELSGIVEVVARAVPPRGERLDRVMVQTQSGEAIRLAPTVADSYSATLDTAKLRNGRQALLVIAGIKGLDASRFKHQDKKWEQRIENLMAEIRVTVRNPYHFYWGDLHAHTSYSDGSRLPKDAYEYARDKAKLDFFAVTDHSEELTYQEYADIIAQADRADQPGRFVALYGAEATQDTGHLNFYLSPTPRLSARLDDTYQAIVSMGLLGHFNHPDPKPRPNQGWRDDFQGFHYAPAADRSMAMVEVRTPEEEAAYIAMLNAGWHVGAAGCEDQHDAKWGRGPTWTVALARELTREGIMEALWSRRTYSARDRNLELTFTLDGEDMGSRITRPAGTLTCLVTVADPSGVAPTGEPDRGEVTDAIDLFLDGRIAQSVRPKLAKYAWATPVTLAPGKHYCFVRVTQAGGLMSWSSPIWVSAY